jgi:hypothetical protein
MDSFEDHIPAEAREQPISAGEQQTSEPADQAATSAISLFAFPKISPRQRQQPLTRLLSLVAAVLIVALLICRNRASSPDRWGWPRLSVDWRDAPSDNPQQETLVMGAFSEHNGALLGRTAIG